MATASSQYSSAYPVSAVNNGERKGAVWGSGGGWNDATANAYPDDVQIDFNGSKTIDRVVVYTLQDNYSSPVSRPTCRRSARTALTAFTVEGWNGSGLTVLGSVSKYKLVKRTLTFPVFTTDAIRVKACASAGRAFAAGGDRGVWRGCADAAGDDDGPHEQCEPGERERGGDVHGDGAWCSAEWQR